MSDSDNGEEFKEVALFNRQQPIKEDQTGQRGFVRIDDVSEAFMALPRMLQLIGERMEGDSNQDYLLSLISPFHFTAKGARIPNIQATQTVTATDFQDLGTFNVSSGAGLFFTQYTAMNTAPWMFLNNVQ